MKDYQKETIATYNKIARKYQLKRSEVPLLDEINKFVSLLRGKRVLDAGTGPGRDATILAKRGCEVIGIDASEEFIKLATELEPEVLFINMDILNLRFDNEYFDGVWCCAVLSHFKKEDFPQTISELSRVLKPGGILFTTVKMGIGEGFQLEEEFSNYLRFTSYFSEPEMKTYLEAGNLYVMESYLFNERERFGMKHRNVSFVLNFSQKKAN
jgi:ubiquinone/menaquinone biosynthesis C-methylase UbiE